MRVKYFHPYMHKTLWYQNMILGSELQILPRLKQVSQKPPTPYNHIADSNGDFCTCKQYSHFSVKHTKKSSFYLYWTFLFWYITTSLSHTGMEDYGKALDTGCSLIFHLLLQYFFACFCPMVSTDGVKLAAINTWKPECMTEMRRTDSFKKCRKRGIKDWKKCNSVWGMQWYLKGSENRPKV